MSRKPVIHYVALLANIVTTVELDDESISFSGATNEDANKDSGMISQVLLVTI